MLGLEHRCTVVNNGIDVTSDHLGVEVVDLRTLRTVGGAELLKHRLEGNALTIDVVVEPTTFLVEYPLGLLAGLALTEHEETVVVTADVESGTGMHALADAQTVGQQLHRGNV